MMRRSSDGRPVNVRYPWPNADIISVSTPITSTALSDWVETLKRYVAMPGTFVDTFPETTDDDLTGALSDGFAETQMDGYFISTSGTVLGGSGGTFTLDLGLQTVTPSLQPGQMSLVVLYAATQVVRAQLLNLTSMVRFEASGASFETQQSSNVLTSMFKDLSGRKAAILERALSTNAGMAFAMADSYLIRAVGSYPGHGFQVEDDLARSLGGFWV